MGQRLGRVHSVADYDLEIRRVLCPTNAIESLNARYRRAIKARGHFPSEPAGRIQLVIATPADNGIRPSMGSVGDSYHNALME